MSVSAWGRKLVFNHFSSNEISKSYSKYSQVKTPSPEHAGDLHYTVLASRTWSLTEKLPDTQAGLSPRETALPEVLLQLGHPKTNKVSTRQVLTDCDHNLIHSTHPFPSWHSSALSRHSGPPQRQTLKPTPQLQPRPALDASDTLQPGGKPDQLTWLLKAQPSKGHRHVSVRSIWLPQSKIAVSPTKQASRLHPSCQRHGAAG